MDPSPVSTERISTVPSGDLTRREAAPGVAREVALVSDRAILSRARAHVASGWHHHGERDVFGYVVRGSLRFEFGPDGSEDTHAEECGFFHVPAGLVHREVNDGQGEVVLTLAGGGPLVINLDGPDPA